MIKATYILVTLRQDSSWTAKQIHKPRSETFVSGFFCINNLFNSNPAESPMFGFNKVNV